MVDLTTLYYECTGCHKRDSQLYHPGSEVSYMDCPFCGANLEFEANCYTCQHIVEGPLSETCLLCRDGSSYMQVVNKPIVDASTESGQ